MASRRLIAYIIDLLIYSVLMYIALFIGMSLGNVFLQIVVSGLLMLVFSGLIFAVVAVLLRGSIGKKIMDLKVIPTVGMMTPLRFFIRDAVVKYSGYLPLIIGLYLLIDNSKENIAIFYTLSKTTGVVLVLLVLAHLVYFLKDRSLPLDVLFFTKIENDIPTALEYSDLADYMKEHK